MLLSFRLSKAPISSSAFHRTYNYIDINDPQQVLGLLFNWRVQDQDDWTKIIDDIRLIVNTPAGKNIYTETGNLYQGKYNIEQWESPYILRVDWSVNDGPIAVTIMSYQQNTYILIHDSGCNQAVKVPTQQLLRLLEYWRDFLVSAQKEVRGEMDIDIEGIDVQKEFGQDYKLFTN